MGVASHLVKQNHMDKSSIAKKIIHFRKLRGVTQETLAEATGLNVRTIQRIESGEVDPRLYTLKSIAEALNVNLEELLPEPTQHELNQLAVLQITPAAFFLFPVVGNVLVPFIFWMMKREELNGINKYGKEIINTQLTYSLIVCVLFVVQMTLIFMPGFFPGEVFPYAYMRHFPLMMLGGMVLLGIVFGLLPAINAYRVYNGKAPWKYPLKINFFK
jgi:uncharacterized Tic20 family protein